MSSLEDLSCGVSYSVFLTHKWALFQKYVLFLFCKKVDSLIIIQVVCYQFLPIISQSCRDSFTMLHEDDQYSDSDHSS